jgi:hypothetical protein
MLASENYGHALLTQQQLNAFAWQLYMLIGVGCIRLTVLT